MTWVTRQLRHVGQLRTSNVDKHSLPGEETVRLCNYTDVYKNDVITNDMDFMVATATSSQIVQFGLNVGDSVFTKDSETADDIGVPAYVASAATDLVCGYHLAILTPDAKIAHPKYVNWALQSGETRAQWAVKAMGVTRVGLSKSDLASGWIRMPRSIEHQCEIADFLDRETAKIDALIEKQTAMIDLLRERKAAIVHRVTTQGLRGSDLRGSGVPWIGTISAAWSVVPLRHYAKMRTGHTPSKTEPSYWTDCDIPWFTLADVWQLRAGHRYLGDTANLISDLGLANSAAELLPAGTVVLSRTASVGFSGIMPKPMATSQDFWNWVCGPELVPEYLLYVFRSMTQHFGALKYGSTHQTIYQGDAAAFRVPLPPLDEQREIVAHLDRETAKIDALIDKAQQFVELARERRAALITAAVTGQIDVTRKAA